MESQSGLATNARTVNSYAAVRIVMVHELNGSEALDLAQDLPEANHRSYVSTIHM